jgi:hypothetical protein
VPPFSPFGTAKKVSVIDKKRLQPTLRVFQEDRLTVVNVRGTNVNHPCQPEALAVADPLEAGSRENLQQMYAVPT